VSGAVEAGAGLVAPGALLAEAETAAAEKEWSRAADLLAGAGESVAVLDKRAFYLSRAKRYDEALDILARLRAREPDNFLWPYMTAYQYYAQELYGEALPWFREALKRNPKHLKSWWRAANALSKSGEELKAISCAGKVLRLWHELPQEAQERERTNLAKASYFLGKVQMRNDPEGAIPLLEQAVSHDGADPYKHYRLGKALRYVGRPEQAIEHLRRARKLKPGDGNIELELAICLGRSDHGDEALSIVRRRADRLRGWDLLKAGQLALDLSDAQLAVQLLERAGRDRVTRKEERVKAALALARAAAPAEEQPAGRVAAAADSSVGRVDVVRPERNFGFLVDERDGVRRHFRLKASPRLRVGDRVSYLPVEGEKGPAARELQRV
jgi:tetratricopeptide (TPR) repeat protein/cold shock CspA family protein